MSSMMVKFIQFWSTGWESDPKDPSKTQLTTGNLSVKENTQDPDLPIISQRCCIFSLLVSRVLMCKERWRRWISSGWFLLRAAGEGKGHTPVRQCAALTCYSASSLCFWSCGHHLNLNGDSCAAWCFCSERNAQN